MVANSKAVENHKRLVIQFVEGFRGGIKREWHPDSDRGQRSKVDQLVPGSRSDVAGLSGKRDLDSVLHEHVRKTAAAAPKGSPRYHVDPRVFIVVVQVRE